MKHGINQISILLLGFLFIGLSLGAHLYASSLVELSLKDLSNKSTDIVIARIVLTKSYFVKEEKRIFTKIELEVLKSLKGQSRAFERLTLTVYGGTVNGTTTIVIGAPRFTPGEKSILFLTKVSLLDGAKNFLVSGLSQGKFNVFTDSSTGIEKVVRDQIDIPLKPEKGASPFPLTNRDAISLQDFVKHIIVYIN